MDNKKRKDKKEKNEKEVSLESKNFDPMGSYTGKPSEGDDRPVQDADDL